MFKSGFVAVVGIPNVGKSTIINQIIGQKVSIASPKRQTTRNMIKGIRTTEDYQIVFLDTPGLSNRQHELARFMEKEVRQALIDVDVILLVIDANSRYEDNEAVIKMIAKHKVPIVVAVNKMDQCKDEANMLNQVTQISQELEAEFVYISAQRREKLDVLEEVIVKHLAPGVQYYPASAVTDYNPGFIIAEIIREKMLLFINEEVPHLAAVVVDHIKYYDNYAEVFATIYVNRDSQKGIVIGKDGAMIKKIRQSVERESYKLLGRIKLNLWVKVNSDWQNDRIKLSQLGYK